MTSPSNSNIREAFIEVKEGMRAPYQPEWRIYVDYEEVAVTTSRVAAVAMVEGLYDVYSGGGNQYFRDDVVNGLLREQEYAVATPPVPEPA